MSKNLGNHYDANELPEPIGSAKEIYYQDGMVPYLRIKVTRLSRSWYLDAWRGREHIKRRLGDAKMMSLVEARTTAYGLHRQLETEVTLPVPKRERAAKVLNIEEAFRRYYDGHLKQNARTADNIEGDFERYFKPISHILTDNIKPNDVRAWLNNLADKKGKATANKQRGTLQSTLRWCASQELIRLNAELFLAVKPFQIAVDTTYLKRSEVPALLAELKNHTKDVRDAVLLLLLTGQRKGNVLAMEWAHVDWDSKVWSIPASETKTLKQYSVALTDKALEILKGRTKVGRYVFPCVRSAQVDHFSNINKAWEEIRKEARLGKLTVHGLRHTVATWLAHDGAQAFQIQQAMQHASVQTSQRYVHAAANNVRDLLNKSQEGI